MILLLRADTSQWMSESLLLLLQWLVLHGVIRDKVIKTLEDLKGVTSSNPLWKGCGYLGEQLMVW